MLPNLFHVAFAIGFHFRYPWEIHLMLKLSEAIYGRHVLAASRTMNIILFVDYCFICDKE